MIANELIIVGFPRTGTTYLHQSLNLLYSTRENIDDKFYTVKALEKYQKIIVPIRNPMDCIASWNLFRLGNELEKDLKFYTRFHSAVLKNANKVALLDFDLFINDVKYIKNKIFSKFSIQSQNNVTVEQIKAEMISNGFTANLPRDNKEELDKIKAELINTDGFDQCVDLYETLKELS